MKKIYIYSFGVQVWGHWHFKTSTVAADADADIQARLGVLYSIFLLHCAVFFSYSLLFASFFFKMETWATVISVKETKEKKKKQTTPTKNQKNVTFALLHIRTNRRKKKSGFASFFYWKKSANGYVRGIGLVAVC